MTEEKTTVVQTETHPSGVARFLAPAAVGLAILLVIGGIALGLQKNNENNLANLPNYSPQYASGGSTSSPTSQPASNAPAPSPTVETTSSSNQTAPKPRQQVASSSKQASTTTTGSNRVATLPDYQAQFALPAYSPANQLPAYSPQFSQQSPSPVNQAVSVQLVVPGHSYTVSIVPGSTVLQVLQAATSTGLSYKTQSFPGLGEKVTELNGVAEGNSKFWLYDINGQFATKGISSQTVQDGERITWKLQ